MTDKTRPFGRVLDKLEEARFFYGKFATSTDTKAANFFFSAFVSAAWSVTFALQAVCSEVTGFRDWYQAEQARLRDDEVAGYLLELRNETQKVALVPTHYSGVSTSIARGGTLHCQWIYRLAPLDGGAEPPIDDAREPCRDYLEDLADIVARCHTDFRAAVDPTDAMSERLAGLQRPIKVRVPQCPIDKEFRKAVGAPYRARMKKLAALVSQQQHKRGKRRRKAG